MVITEYFKSIEQLLSNSKLITDKAVDYKEFSSDEGMVTGRLLFLGGYVLTFMEYIKIGLSDVISEIESMIINTI